MKLTSKTTNTAQYWSAIKYDMRDNIDGWTNIEIVRLDYTREECEESIKRHHQKWPHCHRYRIVTEVKVTVEEEITL